MGTLNTSRTGECLLRYKLWSVILSRGLTFCLLSLYLLCFGTTSGCSTLTTKRRSAQGNPEIESRSNSESETGTITESTGSEVIQEASSIPPRPKKVSVWIGPGLSHAFYGAGVLRGLSDLGVEVERVSGSEMGGIIALLFAWEGNINDFEWRLLSLKEECLRKLYRTERSTTQEWISKWLPRQQGNSEVPGDSQCLEELFEDWINRSGGARSLSDLKVPTVLLFSDSSGGKRENKWISSDQPEAREESLSSWLTLLSRARPYLDLYGKRGPLLEDLVWKKIAHAPLAPELGDYLIWIDPNLDGAVKPLHPLTKKYFNSLRKITLRLSSLRSRAHLRLQARGDGAASSPEEFSKKNTLFFEGQRAIRNWYDHWDETHRDLQNEGEQYP